MKTPATVKGKRYRIRQLMEAGNSTAQAAKRLGISNAEILEHLAAMAKQYPHLPGTAGGPSAIDPAFTKKPTITSIKADIAREREEDAKRSHTTPVYRRTCEDALALLNLETMSLESRVRLTSQMISDTLRRWPTEHKHHFVTDEDGVILPCACGTTWKPTPGQST